MATKLTDRTLRDLVPRESEYTLREGDGFGVRVRPTGRKTFVLIYEINGRRRRLGLGEYPQTSLPGARTRLAEARLLLGQEVPEPQIMSLLGLGVVGLFAFGRTRRGGD